MQALKNIYQAFYIVFASILLDTKTHQFSNDFSFEMKVTQFSKNNLQIIICRTNINFMKNQKIIRNGLND